MIASRIVNLLNRYGVAIAGISGPAVAFIWFRDEPLIVLASFFSFLVADAALLVATALYGAALGCVWLFDKARLRFSTRTARQEAPHWDHEFQPDNADWRPKSLH